VFLLPLAVVALVVVHVLLVRKHGIVPPFQLSNTEQMPASTAEHASAPEPGNTPSAEQAS
jgi:ubiquinol-cytochrome c reductase cytochrome b subunit